MDRQETGFTQQVPWQPRIFDRSSTADNTAVDELIASNHVWQTHDTIVQQLTDLAKARHPRTGSITEACLSNEINNLTQGVPLKEYGRWIYYPWSGRLVHLLPPTEFQELRLNRNQPKITKAEQQRLAQYTIGIVGLSVGNAVALTLALEGIGGFLKLADFDHLELSNMNRLRAGVHEIGLPKTVLAARQIYEMNPYAQLSLFHQGLTTENLEQFLLGEPALDIVVDECDDIRMKIVLRERARALRLPVLMETSDRGMFDVERFDLEASRPLLHGFLGALHSSDIPLHLTTEQKIKFVLPMVGVETLSTRGAASLFEIGETIVTWPQLGSDVVLGGATVSKAVRRLVLGESLPSGRHYIDLSAQLSKEVRSENNTTNLLPNQAQQFNHSAIAQIPELIQFIVAHGILAPSGGNSQPWRFYYDNSDLWVVHDRHRSRNLFDDDHRGAYIALGAAIKNITIAAAYRGYLTEVVPFPSTHELQFPQEEIAAKIRLSTNQDTLHHTDAHLFSLVSQRVTNRRIAQRLPLDKSQTETLQMIASKYACRLTFVTDDSALAELSQILGAGERIRLLVPELHQEMMAEIRWTQQEAQQTSDGIDLTTLELTGSQTTMMKVLSRPDVAAFLRAQNNGARLAQLNYRAIQTASGIGLISVEGHQPSDMLRGGQAIEHLWLKAHELGLAWQPVTALIYLFEMLNLPSASIFNCCEQESLLHLQARFERIFAPLPGHSRLMLFKLAQADAPTTRSLRLPLEHVLFYGKPQETLEEPYV